MCLPIQFLHKVNMKLSPRIDPLDAELNPICHLLALLGAHRILHVGKVGVKEGQRHEHDTVGVSRILNLGA
jgi:hypothetical protein